MKILNPHPLVWQCVLLVFSGFVAEILIAIYTLALTQHQVVIAVVFSGLTPFLFLIATHFFVEANTFRKRVLFTAMTGLGYSVGTWVALLLF